MDNALIALILALAALILALAAWIKEITHERICVRRIQRLRERATRTDKRVDDIASGVPPRPPLPPATD